MAGGHSFSSVMCSLRTAALAVMLLAVSLLNPVNAQIEVPLTGSLRASSPTQKASEPRPLQFGSSKCAIFGSCETCAASGCMWCPSDNRCKLTNETCVASGTAGAPATKESQCLCTNPSKTLTSCASCLGSSCQGMGWCPSTGTCF